MSRSSIICFAIVTAAVVWWLLRAPLAHLSVDVMAQVEPAPPAIPRSAVVVLGVDSDAFRVYGQPPRAGEPNAHIVDRKMFVRSLQKLRGLKPLAIGLDFLFHSARDKE